MTLEQEEEGFQMSCIDPQRTLLVIFGASVYEKQPDWSCDQFAESAEGIKECFTGALSLPLRNLHYLFDEKLEPLEARTSIEAFIKRRKAKALKDGAPIQDLLIYYIGHGGFARSEYVLTLPESNMEHLSLTTLSLATLTEILKKRCSDIRCHLFIDACFSGQAGKIQSNPDGVLEQRLIKNFESIPTKGIGVLTASSASIPAIAPENSAYTMFSGAILEVLNSKNDHRRPYFTMRDLHKQISKHINGKYTDPVLPNIYCPEQEEGEVTDSIQLFRNALFKEVRVSGEHTPVSPNNRVDLVQMEPREDSGLVKVIAVDAHTVNKDQAPKKQSAEQEVGKEEIFSLIPKTTIPQPEAKVPERSFGKLMRVFFQQKHSLFWIFVLAIIPIVLIVAYGNLTGQIRGSTVVPKPSPQPAPKPAPNVVPDSAVNEFSSCFQLLLQNKLGEAKAAEQRIVGYPELQKVLGTFISQQESRFQTDTGIQRYQNLERLFSELLLTMDTEKAVPNELYLMTRQHRDMCNLLSQSGGKSSALVKLRNDEILALVEDPAICAELLELSKTETDRTVLFNVFMTLSFLPAEQLKLHRDDFVRVALRMPNISEDRKAAVRNVFKQAGLINYGQQSRVLAFSAMCQGRIDKALELFRNAIKEDSEGQADISYFLEKVVPVSASFKSGATGIQAAADMRVFSELLVKIENIMSLEEDERKDVLWMLGGAFSKNAALQKQAAIELSHYNFKLVKKEFIELALKTSIEADQKASPVTLSIIGSTFLRFRAEDFASKKNEFYRFASLLESSDREMAEKLRFMVQ